MEVCCGDSLKYLVIVGDGMADYPIPDLGHRTPLQVAYTPNMDYLSENGKVGLLRTIPESLEPGSDTANISILGYAPEKYRVGRGALEAVSRGVSLSLNDVAFRCNLITEDLGRLDDYSAGQISTLEANQIINSLIESFGKDGVLDLYCGVGYRHLLVLRNTPSSDKVRCVLPHHAQGRKLEEIFPTALTEEAEDAAKQLRRLILDSKKLLKNHEVNLARESSGKKPANMMWPWGPGKKISFPSFKETHGIDGSIIAAVDLIKGIAGLMSMKILDVPGATGYFNTNYENKASYALRELEETDLVFIHVEAPDEASHKGDFELKIRTIEDFDRRLLGRVLNGLKDECVISVLPDHYTSLRSMRHTWDPVPFLIFSSDSRADNVSSFDEVSAIQGSLGLLRGDHLIPLMLKIGEALRE